MGVPFASQEMRCLWANLWGTGGNAGTPGEQAQRGYRREPSVNTRSVAHPRTNWAGNVSFRAVDFHRPATLGRLQAVVARAGRIRVLGTGHSFNDVADSPGGTQVSLAGLPRVTEVDSAARVARVSAGLSYAEIAGRLDEQGFALRNLASLPHISVAGACATATHGSGAANGNLATAIAGLDLVTADGDLVTIRRPDDWFDGAVVHLGALGVVVSLLLELVPSYDISQRVYEGLPLDVLDDHFTDTMASGYSVSLFTDWRAPRLTQVWIKQRAGDPASPGPLDQEDPWPLHQEGPWPLHQEGPWPLHQEDPWPLHQEDPWPLHQEDPWPLDQVPWFTATPAPAARNPVPGLPPDACTQQLGVPGPWYARLPHFRPEFTPSVGDELQSEYLLPVEHAVPALHALNRIRGRLAPVLRICEIRVIAADELWLSPCYRRDSVAFHFTWVPDTAAVLPVVTLIERQLAPFAARPHWGKIFTTAAATLRSSYQRLPDFLDLARRYDPAGKFRNAYTDRCLGG
jgi:alditol oxidase